MKNRIFFFLVFVTGNVNSQTSHNLVFNDIILIGQNDAITNGKDYLIDLPIFASRKVITIYNNTELIPAKLFFEKESFLENQNKIILITPDIKYYKAISDEQKKTGYELHPVRQRKIYYINRSAKTIDSITIIEDYVEKTLKYNMKKMDNEKSLLFKQCLNLKSKDLNSANDIASIIKSFEKENYIKLQGIQNKEASCVTLSTDNLANEQKFVLLNFLTYLSKLKNVNKKVGKIFLPK